jgi:hypothetical protein
VILSAIFFAAKHRLKERQTGKDNDLIALDFRDTLQEFQKLASLVVRMF